MEQKTRIQNKKELSFQKMCILKHRKERAPTVKNYAPFQKPKIFKEILKRLKGR
jgi:hypothetical protein